MYETEAAARRVVVEAAHRLVASGLVARTWGNLSARLSEEEFVITPSGRPYDTMTPEDLVKVRIADCAYDETEGRPSSEKGIHADAYRLHGEMDFVIHTHQLWASAIGLAGRDLCAVGHPLLGDCVPCAAYGMPSTKKLRRAVAAAEGRCLSARAVLLPHHGALCLGKDAEEAFAAAEALEAVARKRLVYAVPPEGDAAEDYGSSLREGDRFTLRRGGSETGYGIGERGLPLDAAIHAAIYRRCRDVGCVRHEKDAAVVSVSRDNRTIRPLLDDLAQIAGVSIRNVKDPQDAAKKLRGRNAVLIWGEGALCTGKSESDAEAVEMILRKDAVSRLCAGEDVRPLGRMDALVQRLVYVLRYSRGR